MASDLVNESENDLSVSYCFWGNKEDRSHSTHNVVFFFSCILSWTNLQQSMILPTIIFYLKRVPLALDIQDIWVGHNINWFYMLLFHMMIVCGLGNLTNWMTMGLSIGMESASLNWAVLASLGTRGSLRKSSQAEKDAVSFFWRANLSKLVISSHAILQQLLDIGSLMYSRFM